MDPVAAPADTAQQAPAPAAATEPDQAPAGNNSMTMLVSKDGGQAFPISAQGLMNTLRASPDHGGAGLSQISGISQDGSRLQLTAPVAGPPGKSGETPTQTREMHIQTAAKALGLKVHSIQPPDASSSPDDINHYLSGVIPSMATDDEKHNFIRNHLKSEGFNDPKVVGSGSDWYNYEPDLHKWYKVTQAPSLSDSSGWINTALQAPQFLGSGIGGTIGTGLGASGGAAAGTATMGPVGALIGGAGGAMAGAAAGGGLGSAAGQGLTKAALAAYDPDYRNALNGSEEVNAVGNGALKDAAVMGVMGPAGKAVGPLVRGAGALAEGTGSVLKGIGSVVKNPIVSEFAAQSIPGPIGAAVTAADVPVLAQSAVKGVPGLMTKFGESRLGQALLSEEQAARLAAKGEDLTRYGSEAGDIGKALDVRKTMGDFQRAQSIAAEQGLVPAAEEGAWRDLAEKMSPGPIETAGRGLDKIAGVGRNIQAPVVGAIRGLGAATKGAGELVEGVGKTSPYADLFARTYGLPKVGAALRDKLIERMIRDRDKNSVLPSR